MTLEKSQLQVRDQVWFLAHIHSYHVPLLCSAVGTTDSVFLNTSLLCPLCFHIVQNVSLPRGCPSLRLPGPSVWRRTLETSQCPNRPGRDTADKRFVRWEKLSATRGDQTSSSVLLIPTSPYARQLKRWTKTGHVARVGDASLACTTFSAQFSARKLRIVVHATFWSRGCQPKLGQASLLLIARMNPPFMVIFHLRLNEMDFRCPELLRFKVNVTGLFCPPTELCPSPPVVTS